MQENAAKIRVKTGNSGAFTEKIEKNQKIYKNGHKNACIYEKDMIYYVSIK